MGHELVVQHLLRCGADINSNAKVAKLLYILHWSLTEHMYNLLFVLSFMHLIYHIVGKFYGVKFSTISKFYSCPKEFCKKVIK